MILTDDDILAERCRGARNLFFKAERRYVHDEIGSNFRMTNMQAAIGCAQLEKIDEHISRKREIGRKYNKLLNDIDCINLPVDYTEYADNIYWVYGIVLNDRCKIDAIELCAILKENGIGSRTFFYPIHKQPVYERMQLFADCHCTNAEIISERGLYIPCGLGITDEQMEEVSKVLHMILV